MDPGCRTYLSQSITLFLFHTVHVLEFLVQSWLQCSHKEKECIPIDQLISFQVMETGVKRQHVKSSRLIVSFHFPGEFLVFQ